MYADRFCPIREECKGCNVFTTKPDNCAAKCLGMLLFKFFSKNLKTLPKAVYTQLKSRASSQCLNYTKFKKTSVNINFAQSQKL